MKCCLYVVNAHMDEVGVAWPSQATIATKASLTENTVQRQLGLAIDLGWLGVETRQMAGKAWKHYFYRSSVPDALENCEKMLEEKIARLVEIHLSEQGPIRGGGRPLKRRNAPHANAAKAPLSTSKVPILKTHDPPSDEGMVPVPTSQVPPANGTKSPSEVPIQSSNWKSSQEAVAQSHNRSGLENLSVTRSERPKNGTDDDASRIRKADAAFPQLGDAELARILLLPVEEVQRMRKRARTS
jgi:hypothetical protein